mmetsp:Transcript_6343/g.13539  ORF Transcript_6343/g.13539 Transcript_6343/m.13539 type:complete len:180 (+) Transcript_6343:125-664(+)
MFSRGKSMNDKAYRAEVKQQEEYATAKKRMMANQARFYEASKHNAYLQNQIASRGTYKESLEEKKAQLRKLKEDTASAREETSKIEQEIDGMRTGSSGEMEQIKFIMRSLNQLEVEKRHTTEKLRVENERLANHLDAQLDVIQALVKQLKSVGAKPKTDLNALKDNTSLVVEKAAVEMN